MSVVAPKRFSSADSGQAVLSGTVGSLLGVLDQTLIIGRQFTAISGASFVDNSVEARLQGGTAFKLFQGPTLSNDEAYFGMSQKFEQIVFNFGTPGVQNSAITLTWEFWNGSAWTSFTPTDGTTKLTANGTVSWPIANLTSWATTSVNSVTLYWVRVRFTAGSWTTNPLANYTTCTGWTRAFSGTNQAVYQQGGGVQFYLEIDDNGPGAGAAKEARVRGYETMPTWTNYGTNTGTGKFPTTVQQTNGLFVRKSSAADATARTWEVICDDRTFYFYVLTTDVSTAYYDWMFGSFYSKVPNDAYNCTLTARQTENTGTQSSTIFQQAGSQTTNNSGRYIARDYLGSASGSILCGMDTGDIAKATSFGGGTVPFPNGPDGGYYLTPAWLHENTTASGNVRGRLRGIWAFCHSIASLNDGDTFSGTSSDGLNGKSFIFRKTFNFTTVCAVFETSDSWETN